MHPRSLQISSPVATAFLRILSGPLGVPGATGPPVATSHGGEVGDSYLRLSLAAVHLVQKPGRFHLGETGRQVMPDRLPECEPGG